MLRIDQLLKKRPVCNWCTPGHSAACADLPWNRDQTSRSLFCFCSCFHFHCHCGSWKCKYHLHCLFSGHAFFLSFIQIPHTLYNVGVKHYQGMTKKPCPESIFTIFLLTDQQIAVIRNYSLNDLLNSIRNILICSSNCVINYIAC